MREYLIDFFKYNDWANRELLQVILQLPEQEEAIRLFSHLITAQNKWLNRVMRLQEDSLYTWFGPIYQPEQLKQKWAESFEGWMDLLDKSSEETIAGLIYFVRPADGRTITVPLRDVVLQLNYHSIHHRAQINKEITRQGFTAPPTDYILTALKEA